MTQSTTLTPLSSEDRHTEPKYLRLLRNHFIGMLLAALLSACSANTVSPVEPSITTQKFGFLHDGETTKQEVLDRMGPPFRAHEMDRTLTYSVFENELGKIDLGANTYSRAGYTLTLIFDGKDVLRQHSLIFQGAP